MIKYVVIPEKKMTIAIMEGCKLDAVNKIEKMCHEVFNRGVYVASYGKQYLMPDTFKASVICRDGDVWDEAEGKRQAKAKVLRNYYRSFDKRVTSFINNFAEASKNFLKNT